MNSCECGVVVLLVQYKMSLPGFTSFFKCSWTVEKNNWWIISVQVQLSCSCVCLGRHCCQ